jgi:ketosteroid isomerase-like protein/quercetin dioxygenase-like cupin family protein
MKRAFAIALLLAIATPALADDAKTIAEQHVTLWGDAYNKGDAAALTALYTADATVLPQGSAQPIIGSANIRKFFDGWLKERLTNAAIPITDAKMIDAKTLWSAGTWSGDQGGIHLNGTWINIMTLQGADWKISADTWNMMPPPAPVTAMSPPVNAEQIKWGPAPPNVPAGAQLAVISGDPSQPGQPYTIRLKMPDGYKVPAHFHPAHEAATVISGTFNLGMGDKLDITKTQALQAGGFAVAPAGMHHFAWAKGETVVQINGNGPFAITYVNPEDDPSKGMAAK